MNANVNHHLLDFSTLVNTLLSVVGGILAQLAPLIIIIAISWAGLRWLRAAVRGKGIDTWEGKLDRLIRSEEDQLQDDLLQIDWDRAFLENARWDREHPYAGSVYETEVTDARHAGRSIYEQEIDEHGGSIYESNDRENIYGERGEGFYE